MPHGDLKEQVEADAARPHSATRRGSRIRQSNKPTRTAPSRWRFVLIGWIARIVARRLERDRFKSPEHRAAAARLLKIANGYSWVSADE